MDSSVITTLISLPQDIFKHIGSYLTLKSKLKLSITNKSYHKIVHNKEYFNKIKELELSQDQLKIIYKNNCDLQCCEMCNGFRITCDSIHDCRKEPEENKCVLYKIICKIQETNTNTSHCNDKNNQSRAPSNSSNITINTNNLDWVKRALNNATQLIVSNKWRCAYAHLPMEWIFDIDNNNNKDKDNVNIKNKMLKHKQQTNDSDKKGVYIRGFDGNTVSFLSGVAATLFAESYETYWVKKCSLFDVNSNSNSKQGGNSVPIIGEDVRSIGDAVITRDHMSFHIATQLHGNYKKYRMQIPQKKIRISTMDAYRIGTLEQYFEIFHSRLKILRVLFRRYDIPGDYKIINTSIINDNNSNSNNNTNNKPGTGEKNKIIQKNNNVSIINYKYGEYITSDLFNKNNIELLNDLNTSEKELSFKEFLKKYNCENKSLPQLESLYFRYATIRDNRNKNNTYASVLLKKLFEHDKLMKLFNFSNSVKIVGFSFVSMARKHTFSKIDTRNFTMLKNSCFDLLNRLNNVTQIDFEFSIKTKNNTVDDDEMNIFFNQFITDITVGCLVKYDKVDKIVIMFSLPKAAKECDEEEIIEETIEISDKQQLSINNRNELIKKVEYVTKKHGDHFLTKWNQKKNDFSIRNNNKYNINYWIYIKRNFCLS